MSRRRRKQPVSLLTAWFVEVGTVIGIVAIAQPTWTRNIIESVGKSPTGSQVVIDEPYVAQVHDGAYSSWDAVQSVYPQVVIPPRLGSLATQAGNSPYSSYDNNF